MPFSPDSPTIEVAFVQQQKLINIYQIHEINMSFTPDDITKTYIYVRYSKGFRDDSGTYCVAEEGTVKLEGDALIEKFAEKASPNATNYSVVKEAVWSHLMAQGIIPSGTIS